MKKIYLLFLVINSFFSFAQFGSKVKFSPENKIEYEILRKKINNDLHNLRKRYEEDCKKAFKTQSGSGTLYEDYHRRKDSLCNAYINNVEKLVSPDQVKYFREVVNRRMKKKIRNEG